MRHDLANVAQLSEFDEAIDVRSPAEFEEDHIPGARNCPALDNAQRAEIGTIYKQVSPFLARKLGAAMVARNLSDHLYAHFQDRPKSWRPLLYCWRGGQRSGAFVAWFRMIGWDAQQLDGGYKAYRRHVASEIARQAAVMKLRVICGATGSAKTRLLEALAAQGAQILDLEALAKHKGSLLGSLPGQPQPTQKFFESNLHAAIAGLDLERTVYVEAESRKIGNLFVPEPLVQRMWAAPCVAIEATRDARLAFLLRDYAYLGDNPAELAEKMACFKGLQSNERVARWKALAAERDLSTLFAELIDYHYDPLYQRSQNRNFRGFTHAVRVAADDLGPSTLSQLARSILETG